MNKILVICGPTATGKTTLAVKLAKKFNGELISADSRQVYRGMDIITGKDQPAGTKIHMIDVINPNQDFNVAEYYHLTWQAIYKVWKAGKLPILVGGTGFYIQTVINGIESFGIPPNLQLRKKLAEKSVKTLFSELEMLDPFRVAKMNMSDRKNPYRLVRALEIAHWRLEHLSQKPNQQPGSLNCLFIGLKAPYKVLYQRIDGRVDERIEQGAEQEIKNLLKRGYRWDNSALGATIGYREWKQYFEGKVAREEIIQRWKFAEHTYARRQMTWFKKNKIIHWFDIMGKKWQDKIEQLAKIWYDTKN